VQSLIGPGVHRVDARLKVTGMARYAAEHSLPGLAYAVVVQSTIARGRVLEIETASARAAPGVLDVITWRNAPRLHPFESNPKNRPGQTYLVLQDDQDLSDLVPQRQTRLPMEPSLPEQSPLFSGVCLVSEAQSRGLSCSGRTRSDRSHPRRWHAN
jgi:hypothetical protein